VPNWPDLVVEPLFEERIVPLASPAFIQEHRLKRPEHLLGVKLIQSNVSVVQWSDWFAAFTDMRAPDRFSVRFDRAQMSLDAATQGLGIALESMTIAGRHIAERKLPAGVRAGQGDQGEGAFRRLSGPPCKATAG
jgi:DNA-binding transcriptional LysR family regulator